MNLLPSALTLSAALLVISTEGSTRRKLHQFLNLQMNENEQAVLKCKSAAVHDHPNRILPMARKDTNAVDKPINIRANVVLITGSDKPSNDSVETVDGVKPPSTVKIQIVNRNGTRKLHDAHNKALQQAKMLKQTADNYLDDYDYRDDEDNDLSRNFDKVENANGKLKAKSAAGATKARYAEVAVKSLKKKLVDKSLDRTSVATKRKGTDVDRLAREQYHLMAAKLTVRSGKERSRQGDKSDDNYYIKKFQSLNHPPAKKQDEKTIESDFFDKLLPRIISDAKPDNDSINGNNVNDNKNVNNNKSINNNINNNSDKNVGNNKNNKNSNNINNGTNNNNNRIRKPFNRAPLTKPVEVMDQIRPGGESEMVKRNAQVRVTAETASMNNAGKKRLSNVTKLRRSVERNATEDDNRKRPVLTAVEEADGFVNGSNNERNGNNRGNSGKEITWKPAKSVASDHSAKRNTNGNLKMPAAGKSAAEPSKEISTTITERRSKTQLKSTDSKSPEHNGQAHSSINSTDNRPFKGSKAEDDIDRKSTANRPSKGKRESGKWRTWLSHDKNVLLLGKDQIFDDKNKPRRDGRRSEASNDSRADKFKSASGSNEKVVFPSLDRHLFAKKKTGGSIGAKRKPIALVDKRSGIVGYKRSINADGTERKSIPGRSYDVAVSVENRNRLNAARTNSISAKSRTKSSSERDDNVKNGKNAVQPLTNVTGSDGTTDPLSGPGRRSDGTAASDSGRNSTGSSWTDVNGRRQSRNATGSKNSTEKVKTPRSTNGANSARQQNTLVIAGDDIGSGGKVNRNGYGRNDRNRNDNRISNANSAAYNRNNRNGNESYNGTRSASNFSDHPAESRKDAKLIASESKNDFEPSEVNRQPTECDQCAAKSVASFQPIADEKSPNNANRLLDEHSDTLTALLFRKRRLFEKMTNTQHPSSSGNETVAGGGPPWKESNQTDSVLIIVININSTDPIPLYDILRNMNGGENDTDNENKSALPVSKNRVSVSGSADDGSHLPTAQQPKVILKRSTSKSEISGKSQPEDLAASELFTQKTIQLLQVIYNRKSAVFMGNALAPVDVQFQPYVNWTAHPNHYYTLVMFDPDFPSKKNPKLKEWQNWLIVNIPSNNIKRGETLTEYIGAFLTPNTGQNRYVFMVFQQPHKLLFDEPHLTNKTLTGRTHFSIRKFAMKYSLGIPVALNYFHSQWDNSILNIYSKFLEQV